MSERLSWLHVALFWLVVMAGMSFAYSSRKDKSNAVDGIVCFIMVCVAGLRHGYIDTRAYRQWFEGLDVSYIFSFDYLLGPDKEKGFGVLLAILRLFTGNGQVFLFVFSLITVSSLFYGIIKRVPDRRVGVFLFIMTGCFLDTMNGLRQEFVAALLFHAVPALIDKRRIVRYFVFFLVVSTFHRSSLLFLPLYFFLRSSPWGKATRNISIILLIIFALFNTGIGMFVASSLEGTDYGEDYGELLRSGNTGTNVLRVAVAAVPLILSYINRGKRKENIITPATITPTTITPATITPATIFRHKRQSNAVKVRDVFAEQTSIFNNRSNNGGKRKEKYYNICFNMTLINFFFWLFSQRVVIFYRLALYTTPFMIVLLCFELERMKKKNAKNGNLVTALAMGCYLAFHALSLKTMGNLFFVGYLRY